MTCEPVLVAGVCAPASISELERLLLWGDTSQKLHGLGSALLGPFLRAKMQTSEEQAQGKHEAVHRR